MKRSTCLKVLMALAAAAAAGAAVCCWLLHTKKVHGCLCCANDDGDFSCNEKPEDEPITPCEEFSDGTAAEEPAED